MYTVGLKSIKYPSIYQITDLIMSKASGLEAAIRPIAPSLCLQCIQTLSEINTSTTIFLLSVRVFTPSFGFVVISVFIQSL